MNNFHEKIFFGSITLISSGFSMLGAVLTAGETRWLYVTLTVSIMTSGFLALMFKKQDETIRLVIGRCGFAVLGGILGTKPAFDFANKSEPNADIIELGLFSAIVCIATFFVGFRILSVIEKNSPVLAEKWFKKFTE